jgi:protein-S-isoprenylcysteine O-methyltransferase Ste14
MLVRQIARLRVPLGFAFGALALVLATPTARSVATGAALAAVGEGLRLWAAGHLEKNRALTASGPYRWMAHPLYVGSALMGIGLAVAANHRWVTLLVLVYLAGVFGAAVSVEERALARRFGESYVRYRAGDRRPDARRFAWARVKANREYRAVVGLAIVIVLLALKACRPA